MHDRSSLFHRAGMRRHYRVLFAVIGLLALSLGLAQTARAEDNRLARIIERGTLRVATTGDYKPFSYRASRDEAFIGLDVDMARSLADALGVELELVATSWPQLMADYRADRFDIAMSGISVNLKRQREAFYSRPYLRDGKTPIARCTRQDDFQTLEQIDRPEVKVIVNPGGTNETFARAHLHQARLTVYPDNVTIFDQIVKGQADLMITDAIETRLQAHLHPELCALHPEQPFDFSEKAYLLPQDIVFKQFVDQWLRQSLESGDFARRLQHWLDYPWPRAHADA